MAASLAHVDVDAGESTESFGPTLPKLLLEMERMCLEEEAGPLVHPFSPAEPSFPMAEGAPRCDNMPVATDTTGPQFRAGKYIAENMTLHALRLGYWVNPRGIEGARRSLGKSTGLVVAFVYGVRSNERSSRHDEEAFQVEIGDDVGR